MQSRYYDSYVGRFLNADNVYILSSGEADILNLYVYCGNNPLNHIDSSGEWLVNLLCGAVAATAFGLLANVVCKILNLDKNTTRNVTILCAGLGGIIGGVLGPSFLAKYAPNLLKAIKQIEKTKFSLKAIGPNTGGNIFGINISNTLIIMLHTPHPKYNEWYYHLQVEVKIGKAKQKVIWKKPLLYVNSKTWGK